MKVGDRMVFKAEWQIARYGATATVTKMQNCFTGSHPGYVFVGLVDLVTENGTKVQWSRSQMKSYFKK